MGEEDFPAACRPADSVTSLFQRKGVYNLKRHLILLLFISSVCAQDVTLVLSGYDDDAQTLDVYMENQIPVYGFQIYVRTEQTGYCENPAISSQTECELEGYQWYLQSGLVGENSEWVTIGSASGGLAEDAGFMVSGNTDGLISGFSLLGNSIPPGEGILTSIYWDGPTLELCGEISIANMNMFYYGPPLCYHCEYVGCMDPVAVNYNPTAIYDSGNCEYDIVGDVNQDEILDVLDIVRMICFILFQDIPNEYEFWAGDVNQDTVIDVLDIIWVVDCILTGCWETAECIDYDGNLYQTIQIGDQIWMKENLKTTHYNSGDPIPTTWPSVDGSYAVYNSDPANADIYGNLYNWYAVDNDLGICPAGFHIPTDEEWMELESWLDMDESELYQIGFRGTDQGSQLVGNADLWDSGSLVGNPAFGTSGFDALPGGTLCGTSGYANGMGSFGYFWSSSADNSNNAWLRILYYGSSGVYRNNGIMQNGFSVRCVAD